MKSSQFDENIDNLDHGPDPASLAVIVCAYTDKRWGDIVDVISSLQSQSAQIGEIALVIDHNPALLERAKSTFGDSIILTENTEKQGLSGARNSGIAATRSPIIAFVDDDAVADPNWAEEITAPYADPNVVGVGGTIKPRWLASRPSWWPEEFDWVVGCTYLGHETKAAEIRNTIGANMSIRRSAFAFVEGFCHGLGRVGTHPVGAEETELCIRIRRAIPHAAIMFAPSARVEHKVPANRSNLGYFVRRCYAEGLSKAVVSRIAQRGGNLSSEWAYSLKTLPLGVLRNLRKAMRGDASSAKRAGAIILGLGVTTLGYLRGRASRVSLNDPSLATTPDGTS